VTRPSSSCSHLPIQLVKRFRIIFFEAALPISPRKRNSRRRRGAPTPPKKTDQQSFHAVLSKREHRHLIRQLCWVLTTQGCKPICWLRAIRPTSIFWWRPAAPPPVGSRRHTRVSEWRRRPEIASENTAAVRRKTKKTLEQQDIQALHRAAEVGQSSNRSDQPDARTLARARHSDAVSATRARRLIPKIWSILGEENRRSAPARWSGLDSNSRATL